MKLEKLKTSRFIFTLSFDFTMAFIRTWFSSDETNTLVGLANSVPWTFTASSVVSHAYFITALILINFKFFASILKLVQNQLRPLIAVWISKVSELSLNLNIGLQCEYCQKVIKKLLSSCEGQIDNARSG